MPTFSVKNDDPFIVFRALQEIARRAKGEDVIDLSRGDPGYGFTPSVRGRKFASYLLFLDSILNRSVEGKFGEGEDAGETWQRIEGATRTTYQEEHAAELLSLLKEFLAETKEAARGEGKNWNDRDIFRALFASSRMSGGSYLEPGGEELTRLIVAAWHRSELGLSITSEDLILTNGASHAIGALFKALGEEGCGYLRRGDTVCIASPVYAPYNRILEERCLRALMFSIDPLTGRLSGLSKESSATNSPKALILINPHNPTGFSLAKEELEKLAEIARDRNMLVIADEVYCSFFEKKRSMLQFAPERTIAINARSKVERSTGLRFGEIITLPRGRGHVAKMLDLGDSAAFERLLLFAKAPGRCGGQFQHTTFVPGPSQLLGIAHIVLGEEERQAYFRRLRENQEVFHASLGLPHRGNLYYVIFDLNALPGCTTESLPMEEKLRKLAEAGVIYLPAYRFFVDATQRETLLSWVRASLVNATTERLREAARRTKQVLC